MKTPSPESDPKTPTATTVAPAPQTPLSVYLACYAAGRCINQFRWHLSQALLLGWSEQRQAVDQALDRLVALLPSFEWATAFSIERELSAIRTRVNEEVFGLAAAECHADLEEQFCEGDVSSTTLCERLVNAWVTPIVGDLIEILARPLQGKRLMALRLGVCADEGLRRPDVYLFMDPPQRPDAISPDQIVEVELDELIQEESSSPRTNSPARLASYSPSPGEFPPQRNWFRSVQQLAASLEIKVTLPSSVGTPKTDSSVSQLRFKAIDDQIRQGLQKIADRWCHAEDEEPPSDFKYGPLVGQKKQLANWVLPEVGRKHVRALENACISGRYWCRKVGETSYELFFKTAERLAQVQKLMALSAPPPDSPLGPSDVADKS